MGDIRGLDSIYFCVVMTRTVAGRRDLNEIFSQPVLIEAVYDGFNARANRKINCDQWYPERILNGGPGTVGRLFYSIYWRGMPGGRGDTGVVEGRSWSGYFMLGDG